MKKLIAIIISALFLISIISLVSAQPINIAKKPIIPEQRNFGGARQKTFDQSPETFTDCMKTKIDAGVSKIKARTLCSTKISVRAARRNFVEAKKRYEKAKEKYLKARKNLINTKRNYELLRQKYKNANETERKELRQKIRKKVAEIIINKIDSIIERINSWKDLNIAPDNADEIINTLEELKTSIEQDENITRETIKNAEKAINGYIRELKSRAKIRVGLAIAKRIKNVLRHSRKVIENLEERMEKLKEKGIDVTKAKELISKVKDKIKEAVEDYNAARDKYKEAKTTTEINELLKEARDKINSARDKIREAFKELKEVIKEIRKAIKEQKTTTEEETTVETTEETEQTTTVDTNTTTTEEETTVDTNTSGDVNA